MRAWIADRLVALARWIDPASRDVKKFEMDRLIYGSAFARIDPREVYMGAIAGDDPRKAKSTPLKGERK